MSELSDFLVESILNETPEKVVALFGGGFKPPTKGHLEVVNKGLQTNPEITEIKILVGGGERNGFTQDQSVKIWNLYNDVGFINKPATIIPVKTPFTYYKEYLKDNPEDKVYVFIGSRPGEEKDQFDVKQRSEFVKKYSDNVIPVEVSTGGGVSGTMARELFKTDLDGFRNMFPENLLDQDFEKIVNILNNKEQKSKKVTSNKTEPLKPINENATYSNSINYKRQIKDLTTHMLNKGMKLTPLPKVIFKNGDKENAENFFGKTAYYQPDTMEIVLYTEGRHPKDIVRSFAHEMIHHMQNLEGRLEGIATTNTQEDDHLNDIEREAYTKGNMTFRNWTDSIDGEEVTSLNENKPITKETLLEEEDKLMAEVVNPDGERFKYEESNIKGLYTYKDSKNNLYFARVFYQNTPNPHFEFKVGWFEDNDMSKPKYEPQLPLNTTGMDNLKRRNTVAKIYRDEVLPYLKDNQKLAKQLDINPISDLRYAFSKRLVQRHTPQEYDIDLRDEKIIISLPKIDEKKTKDPFGLNQFARELMGEIEKPIAESLEKQEEVRIFSQSCGCDKTKGNI